MSPSRLFVRPVVAALAAVSLLSAGGAQADTTLLNVSYDVARELYKEINPAFVAHWQRTTGEKLTVNQSHGGSSKQIQSVIAGLEADVVTMNQAAALHLGNHLPGPQGQPEGHQGLGRSGPRRRAGGDPQPQDLR